jgi:hypothetical protein
MRTRRLALIRSALSGLTLLGLLGIAAPARARGETHDGFYFNGQIGFGGSTIVIDDEGFPDVEFENGNGDFSLDLGGALNENLVLFGRLWSIVQNSPNAESAGVELDLDDDVSVFAYGTALGARYYFMPINLYAGASLGVARFGIEADGDSQAESDFGFGFQLEVGKEWWVDADWAIGVGGRFTHASAEDDPRPASDSRQVSGDALGVLFTATYN